MGRLKTFSTTLDWVKAGVEDKADMVELERGGCCGKIDNPLELSVD